MLRTLGLDERQARAVTLLGLLLPAVLAVGGQMLGEARARRRVALAQVLRGG